MQSAKSILELRAQVEQLKSTRFEAKCELDSIKTSLSWRVTRPLRVLRDAIDGFVHKSQRRFPILAHDWPPIAKSILDLTPFGTPSVHQRRSEARAVRQLLAKSRFEETLATFEKNKETVLLVTHEVSRTGAPILVLNLANSLKKKYNILLLALGSGSLAKEFSAVSNLMIGPLSAEQLTPRFLELLFREVAARVALKYAIVNSMASGAALSALWENDIAVVHLIHEFPACMRPRGQFRSSAFFSSEQIFSAEMVRMSALEETPGR